MRTEQPSARPVESLSGLIERVTFFNEENGWAVLKVKAKGHRDLVAVVGSLASVSVNLTPQELAEKAPCRKTSVLAPIQSFYGGRFPYSSKPFQPVYRKRTEIAIEPASSHQQPGGQA